jgi:hypothetical protein
MVGDFEKIFENIYLNNYVLKEQKIYSFINKIKIKNINFFLYITLLFLLPLIFHAQLFTGIFVNFIFVKSAINYNSKQIMLLSFIPSISAFVGGFIFFNFNYALIYMLPFIWLGNFIFTFGIKKLFVEQNKNYLFSGILLAFIKTCILFLTATIFFYFSLVPEIFLISFGLVQFLTAILGVFCFGSIDLLRAKNKIN